MKKHIATIGALTAALVLAFPAAAQQTAASPVTVKDVEAVTDAVRKGDGIRMAVGDPMQAVFTEAVAIGFGKVKS